MENNEKRSRFALVRMIRGLAQPTNTRAYKEARIALERLSAPIVAVLIPVLAAVVLAVVTAMRPRTVSIMEVQLADSTWTTRRRRSRRRRSTTYPPPQTT